MSHFSVLIIGEDPEAQLIPYQSGCDEIGVPEEYQEFKDVEEEERKKYEEESAERVLLPDGTNVSAYEDKFYVPKDKKELFSEKVFVIPEGHKKVDMPLKEVYKTFEEYMEKYSGCRRDDKIGKYGYWHNPNAKWDWYGLGGRWRGFFKLKHKNAEAALGDPGVSNNPPINDCDQARKGQIDFSGMMDAAGEKARAHYIKVLQAFGGSIPIVEHLWDSIIDESNEQFNKMSIDEKREFYHNQEALKKMKEVQKKLEFSWGDDIENYQSGEEAYVEKARADSVTTFAVLKEGKWYESGEMGWWGMVSNEKDPGEWSNRVSTLISDLPDDTLMSVYDCHI